ncbi:transmembrane protein 128 [Cyanistes caeruleus]|nr:transmembrane protein 128 [Cyanistes caeruleus]
MHVDGEESRKRKIKLPGTPSDKTSECETSKSLTSDAFLDKESTAVEKTMRPLNRLNIHSAFWILASIAVTYYFDFLKNIKETMQADSWWLSCGTCLLAACLSVAFYCILYLEWYCGIQDYDEQYPALIPITTATFIAAAICFNVALWPVWSFFTPVLLFIQFMGVVMLVSLLG